MEINNKKVLPIGLGTFGFGEEVLAEQRITEQMQIDNMIYAMNKGVNYIVGYLTYANGKASELLAQAVNHTTNDLYITFCAYPSPYTQITELENAYELFLKKLNRKKVDTFMLSSQMEGKFGRELSIDLMKRILANGLADSVGVTNFNLEQLNHYSSVFGSKLVLHELCHNFEIRIFEDLGIIKRGDELGLQTITYQPLRRNRTAKRGWPLLISLSNKYGKTVNQIILNWLSQNNILSLVKANNREHIDENLAALDFVMDASDINAINQFSVSWQIPKLNWDNFNSEDGLYVAKLPNVFDEIYDSQK